MEARCTAPWPADIAARIDHAVAEHRKLDWPAPVCGVMSA